MTLSLEFKVGLIPGVLDFLSSYHSAFGVGGGGVLRVLEHPPKLSEAYN